MAIERRRKKNLKRQYKPRNTTYDFLKYCSLSDLENFYTLCLDKQADIELIIMIRARITAKYAVKTLSAFFGVIK